MRMQKDYTKLLYFCHNLLICQTVFLPAAAGRWDVKDTLKINMFLYPMQTVANQSAAFQTDVEISSCHVNGIMFLIRVNLSYIVTTKYFILPVPDLSLTKRGTLIQKLHDMIIACVDIFIFIRIS